MDMVARIDAVLEGALDKTIAGAVILVSQDGELVFNRAVGWLDREAGAPMPDDAIFRLASLTKPLVATAALAMADKGLLGLDDLVTKTLPWFRPRLDDGREAEITIRQLLTHTAGLGYGSSLGGGTPEFEAAQVSGGLDQTSMTLEENIRRLVNAPMLFAPGTGWSYSLAIDVLGLVLATINGTSVDGVLKQHLTGPLQLGDTGFSVSDLSRLTVAYADGTPPVRMTDPQVVGRPDEGALTFSPSRILDANAFQGGGAGAAGTAPEFLAFLETLRTGGGAVLRPQTVNEAFSNQIGDIARDEPGAKFGLIGAVITDPVAGGLPYGAGTVTWGGVYGHYWFIDPINRLSVVAMTNTAVEGCLGRFPNDIRDAIYG